MNERFLSKMMKYPGECLFIIMGITLIVIGSIKALLDIISIGVVFIIMGFALAWLARWEIRKLTEYAQKSEEQFGLSWTGFNDEYE